jgi:hypothetical protein
LAVKISGMTLTTHAIVGAAVASVVPTHPVLAFSLGFCSHFLVDMIPHWDYELGSFEQDEKNPLDCDMKIGRSFFVDLCKIGADFLLGFVLVFLFFGALGNQTLDTVLFFGALGAVTPDALQFLYFKWKHQPLTALQKFHLKIQHHLENNHFLGRLIQISLIVAVVLLEKAFIHF